MPADSVLFEPPRPLTLSVVVPCYNEVATIDRTIDAVLALSETLAPTLSLQMILVDDASRDGTWERLAARAAEQPERIIIARHERNRGKGAAIATARALGTGDFVVIQDADLEYDPKDIPRLLAPMLDGRADAVLGSRFTGGGEVRVLYFWHRIANGMLTLLSDMFTDLNVTDMETGYKAFTGEAFRLMLLTNERFGIEPEIVARLAQMRARVYEVPISYHGRTYEEGKKITWRDGAAALWHILRARFSASRQPLLVPSTTRARPPVAAPARGDLHALGSLSPEDTAGR